MPFYIIIFCVPRQRTVLDPTTATAEDIKVAERYMRVNALDSHKKRNNNREEMMDKFKLTRESRRAYIKAKDGSLVEGHGHPHQIAGLNFTIHSM